MALTRQIKAGTTDVSVVIRIVDSSDGTPETGVVYNTSGIDLEYRREGAASVDITEATLAALTTSHTDGGFLHIGNGYYRLDLPDAAVEAGASGVLVHGTVTGMVVIGCYIELVAYDPFDAVRMGMTALPNAAADAAGGLPISDAGGLDLDAQIGTDIDAILADSNELQGDWANGGRLDLIIDAILADTNELQGDDIPGAIAGLNDPTAAAIADAVWDEVQSGHVSAGSFGEIATEIAAILDDTDLIDDGTSGLAKIATDVAAILVDTAEIGAAGAGLTEAGGTGDQLTAVPYNAAWDAEIQSEVTDALNAYDPPTRAELTSDINGLNDPTAAAIADAVWDEDATGHQTVGTFGQAIGDPGANTETMYDAVVTDAAGTNVAADIIALDTVADAVQAVTDNLPDSGALTSIAQESTLGSPTDFGSGTSTLAANLQDIADNGTATFDRSTDSLQAIRDHVGDGTNLTEAGGTGDHLTAVPWNSAWDAEVQSEATDALNAYDPPTKTELDSGFAALNDPAASAIADAVLDEALAGHTTAGTLGKAVADIEVDTAEIGTAGAGLTEAGGTGDHLTAVPWNSAWDAEVESEVADALEATIADSVPADGTAPSVKQALYMLTQFMTEREVSSTTVTVKKPDGSTSLFTLTLDDGTSPTSITRAT